MFKIAVRHQIPSLEADFIADALSADFEVTRLDPYDVRSHSQEYDLAICVGPVDSCPLAYKRVLFILGQTVNHLDLGWHTVVVTSEKARRLALERFGHRCRVLLQLPPILGLEMGRRRIMEPTKIWLHASDYGCEECDSQQNPETGDDEPTLRMCLWATNKKDRLFNALEFNSLVRAGARGWYPTATSPDMVGMEDGYDIQVRRHLSLGGFVSCSAERGVLGDLVDYCDKAIENPIDCAGDPDEYRDFIKHLVEEEKL